MQMEFIEGMFWGFGLGLGTYLSWKVLDIWARYVHNSPTKKFFRKVGRYDGV